nr:unnamed protein product [Callosobruchus chinensis]
MLPTTDPADPGDGICQQKVAAGSHPKAETGTTGASFCPTACRNQLSGKSYIGMIAH